MNLLLAVLATLRLTRFVTTDWLGEWWLVGPAKTWAKRAERVYIAGPHPPLSEMALPDNPRSWQGKLVKGLDCPFCVGFWIGAAVLLSLTLVRAVPPLLPIWRLVMGAFALNYVVGHVSHTLDG